MKDFIVGVVLGAAAMVGLVELFGLWGIAIFVVLMVLLEPKFVGKKIQTNRASANT